MSSGYHIGPCRSGCGVHVCKACDARDKKDYRPLSRARLRAKLSAFTKAGLVTLLVELADLLDAMVMTEGGGCSACGNDGRCEPSCPYRKARAFLRKVSGEKKGEAKP